MERMKHFAGMWLFSGISTQPRLTHTQREEERGGAAFTSCSRKFPTSHF